MITTSRVGRRRANSFRCFLLYKMYDIESEVVIMLLATNNEVLFSRREIILSILLEIVEDTNVTKLVKR